jgi:hypothetical protein
MGFGEPGEAASPPARSSACSRPSSATASTRSCTSIPSGRRESSASSTSTWTNCARWWRPQHHHRLTPAARAWLAERGFDRAFGARPWRGWSSAAIKKPLSEILLFGMFAVQVDGTALTTVEGLAADDGALNPLQAAFREAHGLQCGFCTPGILMSMTAFLRDHPSPDEAAIREALSGHLCRCTGYANIVRAISLAHDPLSR